MSREYDNFDEFADNYRETHDKAIKLSGADSNYFSEYKIVELKKYEKPEAKLEVLDFGCGDGNSTVFINQHFPNAVISGVDVSKESIKLASNKAIKNATFDSFDGFNMPYEDESFDVVFTSMVFHHIEHKFHADILQEILRTLKPEGRFYIFEHNPNNPLTRKVVRECEFDKDAVLLKPGYALETIKKAGFEDPKVSYTIFFPRSKIFNKMVPLEKAMTWIPIGAQYYIQATKSN